MTRLTEKGVPFVWNIDCEASFKTLKDKLVNAPILVLPESGKRFMVVAKMASHAIFQYNVLAIDDTHNTWTNMIVKMNILRLLG